MHHMTPWLACLLLAGASRTRRTRARPLVCLVGMVCLIGQMTLWHSLVQGAENAAAREQAHQWTAEARTLARAGNVTQAEVLLKQALALVEQAFGPVHPHVAVNLHSLADLYRDQRRWGEAEPLVLRALQIREAALGPAHPDVVESLGHLAALRAPQDPAQAHQLYDRARRLALAVAQVNT